MIAQRSDCPDDLLAASVARPLSELERHALDLHVANCADCATACTAVALFQQIPGAEPGDDALVARVAARLAVRLAGPGGAAFAVRRGRWLAVAAASLLLCTAAGAVAMGLWSRRSKVTTQPVLDVPEALPASSARSRTPPSPPENLTPSPPAREVVEPAAAPRAAVKLARNRPARAVPLATGAPDVAPPDTVTAADLFRRANAARGNGQLAEAAELYRALHLRFPSSPEAIVSSISLGKVLLALGDHEPALAAFDRYTGQVAPAPLMEEALVGKGRTLRLLGRAAAERATWLDLLARFPGSAYEALAKQRLAELPR